MPQKYQAQTIPADFDERFMYLGISVNQYYHGMTPIRVYAYDVNSATSSSKDYRLLDYAPGFNLGINIGDQEVKGRIEFCRNTARGSAAYQAINPVDSTLSDVKENLKISNSQFKVAVFMVPQKYSRVSFGASVDIGVINNRIKRTGEGYSGKWEKFYTHTGLGKDYQARSMVAGVSLYFSYLLNKKIMFTLSKQFLIMDADVDGYAGKNVLLNSQHFQYALAYVF